jgi:hypothetical protein
MTPLLAALVSITAGLTSAGAIGRPHDLAAPLARAREGNENG